MTYGNDPAPFDDGLLDPGEDMGTHPFVPTPGESRQCLRCGEHENKHPRASTIPADWQSMTSRERHAWGRGDDL